MPDRSRALAALRARPDPVGPERSFTVEPFRPEDAEGLARLFLTIYGDAYPIDAWYEPDAIRREQSGGTVSSMVARLDDGAIAGHMALYRSSAPFPGLLECGLGMVHPHYRGSFMAFFLFKALMAGPAARPEVAALFGEAVCDTIATQHMSSLYGFLETGLEMDLLPDKGAGRVSCLYQSRENVGGERVVHVPAGLEDILGFFMDGYVPKRRTAAADGRPCLAETEASLERFDFAGVLRVHVARPGRDFARFVRDRRREAAQAGCANVQWLLNLGVPECGEAAQMLLDQGCFPAGFLPRWFDDDALLLQQLDFEPGWDRPLLYSERAREMLSRLRGLHRGRTGA